MLSKQLKELNNKQIKYSLAMEFINAIQLAIKGGSYTPVWRRVKTEHMHIVRELAAEIGYKFHYSKHDDTYTNVTITW